jgi:hypothetical protein
MHHIVARRPGFVKFFILKGDNQKNNSATNVA